jgi:hypothetical protein
VALVAGASIGRASIGGIGGIGGGGGAAGTVSTTSERVAIHGINPWLPSHGTVYMVKLHQRPVSTGASAVTSVCQRPTPRENEVIHRPISLPLCASHCGPSTPAALAALRMALRPEGRQQARSCTT